jgi:hypothetical protein
MGKKLIQKFFKNILGSALKEVKEVPNTLNRLRELQMMSSIFPKYAVVVFVIGLYFVAGTVLVSYYVTAAG